MKNNKAFTLIELLAVIVILILMLTIITPKIFKYLKTAENITEQEQINTLIETAKLYTNQNTNLLPEENDINIVTLQQLKESGIIKTNQILNPKTKEELTGCIKITNENNKYKYEYKDECDLVTVTFDSQGGELEQTTKNVLYHDEYGELPTPTKEGYNFLGWNGKNLININNFKDVDDSSYSIRIINDEIILNGTKYACGTLCTLNEVAPNLNDGDTVTFNIKTTSSMKRIFLTGANITWFPVTTKTITEEILNSKIFIYNESLLTQDNEVTISNIQLELGDTATEYEPYYITDDTTVVQEDNHTLKAIWQADE